MILVEDGSSVGQAAIPILKEWEEKGEGDIRKNKDYKLLSLNLLLYGPLLIRKYYLRPQIGVTVHFQ